MTTASGVIDARSMLPANEHRMQTRVALFVIVAIPVLCIVGNQAGLLRIVFPLLSVIVGALLLWRSKPLYVGFVFWLWFLTPFLRRMADFQGGWSTTSAVLLAPYVTAGLSGFTLLTSIGNFWDRKYLPYVCSFVAVAYGLIIGVVHYPVFNVLQALLNWLVPIIFGMFIFENRRYYGEFQHVIEKSFLYAVLVTGAYGIYQFFVLPDWDKTWMLNVQMNSFGTIEAMKIRVFSTMNAPTIFGAVMACGILVLFNARGKLRLLSAAVGFVGLMLTMSRSSWLSLAGGAAFLLIRMEMRQRARLAVAFFACIVFFAGLTFVPVVHELVWERIQTFADPSHDVSFSARIEGHESALRQIAQEPFGEGLGSTDTEHGTEGDDDIIGPHDSTPLEFLYSLGWIGSLIYALGLGSLGFQIWRKGTKDRFALTANAILVGFVAECLLNSVMLGILGFMVWTFGSMSLAENAATEFAVDAPEHEFRTTINCAAA
jgi:O-Antigen ligase